VAHHFSLADSWLMLLTLGSESGVSRHATRRYATPADLASAYQHGGAWPCINRKEGEKKKANWWRILIVTTGHLVKLHCSKVVTVNDHYPSTDHFLTTHFLCVCVRVLLGER